MKKITFVLLPLTILFFAIGSGATFAQSAKVKNVMHENVKNMKVLLTFILTGEKAKEVPAIIQSLVKHGSRLEGVILPRKGLPSGEGDEFLGKVTDNILTSPQWISPPPDFNQKDEKADAVVPPSPPVDSAKLKPLPFQDAVEQNRKSFQQYGRDLRVESQKLLALTRSYIKDPLSEYNLQRQIADSYGNLLQLCVSCHNKYRD